MTEETALPTSTRTEDPVDLDQSRILSPPSGLRARPLSHFLVAVCAGLLLGCVFLDPFFAPTVWVALVPLILLIRDRDTSGNFLMGWLVGFIWFFISCHWLRHVTWAGWGCLALVEGIWLGLWMILAGCFHLRWRLLLFPMLWVCMEMLRSKGDVGFSWNLLGHMADPLVILAQGWGVYGLSFLVAASSALLAGVVLIFSGKMTWRRMPEGAGFFLLLPLIWLGIAWHEVAPVPLPDSRIDIGLVQGSFPQSLKWSVPVDQAVNRYIEDTKSLVARNRADLILWPEVALPVVLSEEPRLLDYLLGQVRKWNVPLLFGVLDRDVRFGSAGPLYNSAVFLDPWQLQDQLPLATPLQVAQLLRGETRPLEETRILPSVFALEKSEPVRIYDKARLLPFGEFVPFGSVLTFIQKFVENRGGGAFSPGQVGAVLETRFGEIGPMICFESTHAALARQAVLVGAVVLVNMTNDAWFLQTAAMRQHALQCRFRAIETGRAVVRSANTGITAVYLPNGEVVSQLPVWTQTADIAEVPLYSHLTFQARVGDFFGWLCLVCFLFSLWLSTGGEYEYEEVATGEE